MESFLKLINKLSEIIIGFHHSHISINSIYILCGTFIISVLVNFIIKRMGHKITQHEGVSTRQMILSYTRRPIKWMIYLLGLTYAVILPLDEYYPNAVIIVKDVRIIGIVVITTWCLSRLLQAYHRYLLQHATMHQGRLDRTSIDAIIKLMKVLLFFIALIVLLQALGVGISGILALGGAGGIGISLAAKDLLSNFFAALMIYSDKPFKVGDLISSPDRSVEGVVEEIGWRLTKIRTFEKRALYVPNSLFITISIENISRMTHRRIREIIRLRGEDLPKLPLIAEQIQGLLKQHEDIDNNQNIIVRLNKFGDSGLELLVSAYTLTTDWPTFCALKQAILLEVGEVIAKNKAEFTYPGLWCAE